VHLTNTNASKINVLKFTARYIKSVVPSTGKQIRALNYYSEVSSKLIKLLFPIPVISAL